MEQQPTCDAIVSFPDALRWIEPLIKAKPDDVIDQALAVEPAVLGVAADVARRTCERLEKYGVCEELCEYVYHQITLAGAMSIELMRKGNAKLWNDLVEPGEEEQKGVDHE
jgi:hypothetical protein